MLLNILPPRCRRGRAFASHAGDRVSIPGRDRPLKVVKIGSASSTAKCSALGVSVTRMTIIKGRPLSQWVWHVQEHSLLNDHEYRALVKKLQPYTGNGDVSILVKNSRVGRKTPNKQTKTKYLHLIERN